MLRVLSFVQHHEKDHPWAHPVDGLSPTSTSSSAASST
jgi:hypothetical protein